MREDRTVRTPLRFRVVALGAALTLVTAIAVPMRAQEKPPSHLALIEAAGKLVDVLSGERWEGVLLARHGTEWSDPVYLSLTSVGLGFQIGAASEDLSAVAMTRGAVDQIIGGVTRLGGTGGISLGKGIASGAPEARAAAWS